MPPKHLKQQARDLINDAFNGIGGVEALTRWAKSSASNRMTFYVQLYAKLIPYSVTGAVDLNVNAEDDTAHAALERILHGLIDERKREESTIRNVSNDGHGIVIDVVANPPAPPPPPAPPAPTPQTSEDEKVVHLKRAVDNDPPRRVPDQPPPVQHPQPTTTELFFEYHRNGGGRLWWGSVGENGRPP